MQPQNDACMPHSELSKQTCRRAAAISTMMCLMLGRSKRRVAIPPVPKQSRAQKHITTHKRNDDQKRPLGKLTAFGVSLYISICVCFICNLVATDPHVIAKIHRIDHWVN